MLQMQSNKLLKMFLDTSITAHLISTHEQYSSENEEQTTKDKKARRII